MTGVFSERWTLAAAEAAEAAQAPAGDERMSTGLMFLYFLIVLAIVLTPFFLGMLIANVLKLKELGFRLGVCLFALMFGVVPFLWHASHGRPMSDVVRLGIDLAGGTNMVFQVLATEEKQITSAVMEQMVGAVSRRINPSGTEEVTVRQVGADRIEVIIPGADPGTVREMKRRMTTLGSLEFGILANRTDHPDIVRDGMAMKDTETLVRAGGAVIARWRAVGEKDGVAKDVGTQSGGGVAWRDVQRQRVRDKRKVTEDVREFLVIADRPKLRVTGKYLKQAGGISDQTGRPSVRFQFDQKGAYLFRRLTSANKPRRDGSGRRLAVLLDERIHSAPRINDVISDVGTIEGDFTREEVDELVSVLNAGALVVPIKPDPISEATVDPTLGYDVRQKGILAIQIAAVAVVVFMLLYYRVAGFVAVLCLALNLALVLGTMVLINATFSLPGLAGLVLTIGMAVDANVLIFERIREETARGSSLRMAIKNGFGRAFTTIVDANVTTLITAVILYMIGTDQVKGFAVTLFIGIVMSMFTSLYVGRLVFDVCEKKRWIRTLNMSRIVGQTNWDFVGRRRLAAIVSALLIVIGLAGFFKRGTENYDIDFTGGTMVTFQFTEDHELEDVKQRLSSMPFFGAAVTVERLTLAGDPEGSKGRHFRVRTTQRDADQTSGNVEDTVLAKINEAFAGDPAFQLLKITMDYGEILEIVSASGAEDSADSTTDATDTESADDGKVDVAREVEITFTDEVAQATIIDAIAEAVADASDVPFSDPETLFEVDGLEGSGVGAEETDVRRFSKVRLRADPSVRKTDFESALTSMQATMAARPHFDEVNSFASSVAREMKQSAVMAIVISLIAIVAYVWFRFQRITFGLAAVAALVHDVLVVLGMVALAAFLSGTPLGPVLLLNDFKINLPMIAAFLTIVGYSLNDTIVVFDRIREVRGKNPAMTEAIVNTSLNQTLARTLLTSITTFLVVAILYSIGGEGIHGFAFCLVLGVIVGTYSSIYVASPVLLWLMNRPTAASRGSGGASRAAAAL